MSLTAGRPKLKLRGLLSRGEPLKVYFPLGVCTDRQRNDFSVCAGKTAESEFPSRGMYGQAGSYSYSYSRKQPSINKIGSVPCGIVRKQSYKPDAFFCRPVYTPRGKFHCMILMRSKLLHSPYDEEVVA